LTQYNVSIGDGQSKPSIQTKSETQIHAAI
jgi:hypothetical protein